MRVLPKHILVAVGSAMAFIVIARACASIGTLHLAAGPISSGIGISVGAAVLCGWPLILGVMVGALLNALIAGAPVTLAVFVALGVGAAAALARLILRHGRVRCDPALRTIADVVAVILGGALVPSAAAAVIGAVGLMITVGLAGAGLSSLLVWRDLWLIEFGKILVLTPLVLVLASMDLHALCSWRTVRVVAAAVGISALSVWMLQDRDALSYLVPALLFLIALVHRQLGATLGAALVGVLTLVLTVHGHGPFLAGGEVEAVVRAGTFVSVGSMTAMLAAAALNERQLAEEAMCRLAVSERALAEAQCVGGIGSFEVDLATLDVRWSDQLCTILGRRVDDGLSSWRFWHQQVLAEDRPDFDEFTRRLHDRCGEGSHVQRVVRLDGRICWVEVKLRYERDAPDGPPVRVRGTCQDVTSLKLAEERLRSLFERAPYPILVLDTCGTIVEANLPAQELFGVEPLVGFPIERFVVVSAGGEQHWYLAGLTASRAGGDASTPSGNISTPTGDVSTPTGDVSTPTAEITTPTGNVTMAGLRGLHANGSEFPLEVFLTPLQTETGTLISVGMRDITEVLAASEILRFQARHDVLTGLPNRMMFVEELELALTRAQATGRPLAVMFADVDDFKLVNDSRGHAIGDLLLKAVAARLQSAVRAGDLVARLGGDEFVILCENLEHELAADWVAQRLANRVAESSFDLAGRSHTLSLSAGIVVISEPGAVSVDRVLRDADTAMYSAKAAGKACVVPFDRATVVRSLRASRPEAPPEPAPAA